MSTASELEGSSPIGCADVVKKPETPFDAFVMAGLAGGLRTAAHTLRLWADKHGDASESVLRGFADVMDKEADTIFESADAYYTSLHREAIAEKPCFEGVDTTPPTQKLGEGG